MNRFWLSLPTKHQKINNISLRRIVSLCIFWAYTTKTFTQKNIDRMHKYTVFILCYITHLNWSYITHQLKNESHYMSEILLPYIKDTVFLYKSDRAVIIIIAAGFVWNKWIIHLDLTTTLLEHQKKGSDWNGKFPKSWRFQAILLV